MRPQSGRWRKGEGFSSATRQSRPGRTCPRAADRPSRRRVAGRAAHNPPRNKPRSRPAAQGSWARICPRLPATPVRAREAAGVVRPADREQVEAPGRRRAELRASRGAARATARRLAVPHRAAQSEREGEAAESERVRVGLQPPARAAARVRAEARARLPEQYGRGVVGAIVVGTDETGGVIFVGLLAVQ